MIDSRPDSITPEMTPVFHRKISLSSKYLSPLKGKKVSTKIAYSSSQ